MKNVICATSILALVLFAQVSRTRAGEEPPKPEKADSNAIEFTGKLRTGIVAIGGETTGTTISANGKSYELDFRQDSKLRALARTLNGKDVVVRGTLQQKEGVEVRQRRIIMVVELRAADAKQDSPPAAKTGEPGSDKAPPNAGTKTSFKGWESYVWQKDGDTNFSLLEGTNRLKTDEEIAKAAVKGIEAIKPKLDELKPGQEVVVLGKNRGDTPPKDQVSKVQEYGKKIGLTVQ